MKLLRLTYLATEEVKAQAFKSNNKESMHYAVKHGTDGSNFGYWLGRISKKVSEPDNISDVFTLKGNNFILLPVKRDSEILRDKLGNIVYTIGIDFNTMHQKDIILYWEIVNKNYNTIEYSISGDVSEIGKGYNGKDRGDIVYKSPAPVLEIYGNCTLNWTAVDVLGDEYTQEIVYHDNDWDVKPITKTVKP